MKEKLVWKLLGSILLLFPFTAFAANTNTNIDSLIKSTYQMPTSKEKVKKLLEIGNYYIGKSNFAPAQKHLAYSLSLSNELQLVEEECESSMFLGISYLMTNTDSSEYFLSAAENMAQKNHLKKKQSNIYNAYGLLEQRKGQNTKAIQYFYKAIEIAETSNEDLIPTIYNSIGLLYGNWTDTNKAIYYFRKGLDAMKVPNDKIKLTLLSNLGAAYAGIDETKASTKYDTAITILEEAEKLAIQEDNQYILTNIYANQGNVYFKIGKYHDAQKQAQKGILLAEKHQLKEGLPFCLRTLQKATFHLNDYEASLDYGKKIIKNFPRSKSSNLFMEVYYYLAKADFALGNYKNAAIYKDSSFVLFQEFHNLEKIKLVEEFEKNYELKELKAAQTLEKARSQEQKKMLYWAVAGLILLSGIAIGFFLLYRSRKKLLQHLIHQADILEQQKTELKELNNTKTQFFANISHELKTPLTLIINPIRNLLERPKNSDQEVFLLKTAEKHSLQLLDLTNQILELTKFEVNKETIHESIINPYLFFKQCFAEFESLANSLKIDFCLKNDITDNLFIKTDEYKLKTITKNLLSNAFKFTPENQSIELTVFEKEKTIEIIVKDTGRGIHHFDLPHIFDRYYQTKQFIHVVEGGTGIGLAISKEYAKLLGGNIEVQSVWGKGSTFKVSILKNIIDTHHLSKEDKESSNVLAYPMPSVIPFDDSKKTILLVEDNLDLQQYIYSILTPFWNIIPIQHGKAALEYLEHNDNLPNLIISDIMMPIMNGLEFIEQLKSNNKFAPIPVIVLTALNHPKNKLKTLRLGIDDYLTKPFDNEELIVRIENLINNKEQQEAYLQENIKEEEVSETENSQILAFSKDDLEWLEKVEKIVEKMCTSFDFSVDMLALEVNLSRSQVHRKLKSLTGLTPRSYINNARYDIARNLLEEKKYSSVKAVSLSVGFKDEKYFSRNYKKRFGKHPSVYLE